MRAGVVFFATTLVVVQGAFSSTSCGGHVVTDQVGSQSGTGGATTDAGSLPRNPEGTGGCFNAHCGPTGEACCAKGDRCDGNGAPSCTCDGTVWQCGGVAGSCFNLHCGPTGSPCCSPGTDCSNAGAGGVTQGCHCSAGIWECWDTMSGPLPCTDLACGPTNAPCCHAGSGCGIATGVVGGSAGSACSCDGQMWHCGTVAGDCADTGCGPSGTPCCENGSTCPDDAGALCRCQAGVWNCG
jgi:hypothetical protein